MSLKKSFVALGMLLAVFGQSVHGQEYNIQPGMWEMTYKMEISGMPESMASMMQKAPQVKRECVTEENMDFKPEDLGGGCTYNTTSQSASKVVWDIQCEMEHGSSTGHGEVNFHGTTTDGWFEMDVKAGPMGTMKMRNTFQGKRVGSC